MTSAFATSAVSLYNATPAFGRTQAEPGKWRCWQSSGSGSQAPVKGPMDVHCVLGSPLTSGGSLVTSDKRCDVAHVKEEASPHPGLHQQLFPRPQTQFAVSSGLRSSPSLSASPMSPTTSIDTSSTVRSDLTLTNDEPLDSAFPVASLPSPDSRSVLSDPSCGTAAALRIIKNAEVSTDTAVQEFILATAKEPAFAAVMASATVTTFSSQGESTDTVEHVRTQCDVNSLPPQVVSNVAGQPTSRSASKPVIVGNYRLGRTLGIGSMGKVKLATNLRTREKLAVKIIPKNAILGIQSQSSSNLDRQNKEFRVLREAAIMRLLRHPHIVSLREVISDPDRHYMFMEYVDGGHMLDYIVSLGKLKERHARKFALQIGSALDYCHSSSIVHRDLKIENIMISKSGTIKVTDFGLANLYSQRSLLSTFCGSLYFAAPELLNARVYTGPEVDVWSFGVVLHVLICGKVPFDDESMPALHAKIKRGIVEYPSWVSPECKHLLSRMLVVNPLKRASMSEIMSHPWMVNGLDEVLDTHVPLRRPLSLPLDPAVLDEITGFDFGDKKAIMDQLTEIVSSEEYQETAGAQYRLQLAKLQAKRKVFSSLDNFPPGLHHPLVSIYHLVCEKMERQGIRRSAELIGLSASVPAPGQKAFPHSLRRRSGILPTTPPAQPSSYMASSKSGRYPQIAVQPATLVVEKTRTRHRAESASSSFPQASRSFSLSGARCETQIAQFLPSSSTAGTPCLSGVGSPPHPRSECAGKRYGLLHRISAALRKSMRGRGVQSDEDIPALHPVSTRDEHAKCAKVVRRRTMTPFTVKGKVEAADDPDAQVEELNPSVGDFGDRLPPQRVEEMAGLPSAGIPGAPPTSSATSPQSLLKLRRSKSATPPFWRTLSRRPGQCGPREFDSGSKVVANRVARS